MALKAIAKSSGSGSGTVTAVIAGTGISVDSTNPAQPIVSATGGGVTEAFVIAMAVAL